MPEELARIVPEVRTLAKPASGALLAARGEVQRNPAIQAAFQAARQEGQTPEQLAGTITPLLEQALEASPEDTMEAAQYLADEYFQIGAACLVIDRSTGRALARFTEDDVWVPTVSREDGTMVQALPRLDPGLEGFLVMHHYEAARDAQLLAKVRDRYPQLRMELDNPKLRTLTRSGRVTIIDEVRDRLPTLLGAVQGTARTFLDHFDIVGSPPPAAEDRHRLSRSTAYARSQQAITDPLTFNLQYDRVLALQARIGTAWVRELALKLSNAPSRRTIRFEDLCEETLEMADFWVIPPDLYTAFLPFVPNLLPVEGVEPMGLIGKVGTLVVYPEGYSIQAREVSARWEISAQLQYEMRVDVAKLYGLSVTDVPVEAIAEIV